MDNKQEFIDKLQVENSRLLVEVRNLKSELSVEIETKKFTDKLQLENGRLLTEVGKLKRELNDEIEASEFHAKRSYMLDEFLKVSLKRLDNIMRPDKIMRQTIIRLSKIEEKLGIDSTGTCRRGEDNVRI